jgi:hypothetical protein
MGNNTANSNVKPATPGTRHLGFASMFLILAVVITLLLGRSYFPGHTLFSNDGPLGRLMSQCHRLPDAFTGVWQDLNSIGYREGGAMPNLTYVLLYLLKPVLFSKLYVSVALLILGLSAWCFFRQSGLAPPACLLGGLAAVLNADFFSTACWGIAGHPLAVAMAFLALAALLKTSSWGSWIRVALAGLAVGMGLAEGADMGAILSFYVAAFVMYQAFIAEGPRVNQLTLGAARVALVAVFAAFLAAQAISALVSTQVEGVKGMAQDIKTKEERWNWATQWSLPKVETLGMLVPGLFGYRMDTLEGGQYWGKLGRDQAWDQYLANGQQGVRPRGVLRQTGSGIYAGVAVALVAIWAGLQSFRRNDSIFNLTQRRWLWFWLGVIAISLPLAYGHYAPFYRLIYRLPYFSTIRNPVKFITPVNFALVILFAYGADGLWRRCVQAAQGFPRLSSASVRFDNWWIWGCVCTLGLSVVAWMVYADSQAALIEYLRNSLFPAGPARSIAAFSIKQVGWSLLFFILGAALVASMLKGGFPGARANRGLAVLGLVLAVDLGRANLPWIIDWDYLDKYASNPVIDFLREKPYEGRVVLEPLQASGRRFVVDQLYHYEWAQQHFQYYDVQALDLVQLPRVPADLAAYLSAGRFDGTDATMPWLLRRWELDNARYMVGVADYLDTFNERLDPVHHRFHILQRFQIQPKPGSTAAIELERLTAELSPTGDFALFEFDGALPRAKLYGAWQVNTNDPDVLHELFSPSFEPARSVIVSGGLPPAVASSATNENSGTVEFVSYAPKDIKLKAMVKSASVLLYNDRFDPNWRVLVDGKSAPLLRCNFIKRGVYLEPGVHEVEFLFTPPHGALFVSLAAVGVGVVLAGILAVGIRPAKVPSVAPVSTPLPVTQPPAPQTTAQNQSRNKRRKQKVER